MAKDMDLSLTSRKHLRGLYILKNCFVYKLSKIYLFSHLFIYLTERRLGEMMNCLGSKGSLTQLMVYHQSGWFPGNIVGTT